MLSVCICRRGLSKYYQGKSQSFTSLSRAMSIEDLAKKETPYRKKMKSCRSYGGGLDIKATISKKNSSSRGSFSSLSCSSAGKRGSFVGSNHNSRLPPIPAQKHFWSVKTCTLRQYLMWLWWVRNFISKLVRHTDLILAINPIMQAEGERINDF